MAKWDVKDGFWRLNAEAGEEWNFAYVLPQKEGEPVMLVVPTSLQMGWIESPGYFCAASETARDVAEQYVETPMGSLPTHKFLDLTQGSADYEALPKVSSNSSLNYLVEVFVDDFINLAIPTSQQQLDHCANATMFGTHDVFPADERTDEDPLHSKNSRRATPCGNWKKMCLVLHSTVWEKQCSSRN